MPAYEFICDPGHGWLKVPMADLEASGVKDQITEFSYISAGGQTAYLEEDCDAPTFLGTFANVSIDRRPKITERYVENWRRPARNFPVPVR